MPRTPIREGQTYLDVCRYNGRLEGGGRTILIVGEENDRWVTQTMTKQNGKPMLPFFRLMREDDIYRDYELLLEV